MVNAKIEMNMAAEIFKLIGHETRLTMLKILVAHDCCVCEFVEIFQATQPAISQHIRKLRDNDLVKEERKGQWIFYSLNKESKHYPFIIKLLKLLPNQNERLQKLERNGTRIICE